MDNPCGELKKIMETCLVVNIQVFGQERGKIMCENIKKLYNNSCKKY